MVFGMSLSAYTFVHVLLSLIGIGSGFIVLFGLIKDRRLNGWTSLFLWSTVFTSVTGFGFPFAQLLPSHIFGALSLVVLTIAIVARYAMKLVGKWRKTYVYCAVFALYLNTFVGVVQAFLKIPVLKSLAPTQSESPFLVAQFTVLVLFVALSWLAATRFREDAGLPATT